MTPTQAELYQRIQAFTFDPPDAAFTFADKLAIENGWTVEYTWRVIEEYRRFVFLAVATDTPMSPSDAVDQAWHLHMLYTQAYWEEFCPQVLYRAFHHHPSRGGQAEKEKLHNRYLQTLASYQAYFSAAPPTDIWPPAQIRDTRDERFVRVSLAKNWVIPKLGWHDLINGFTPRAHPEQTYRVYTQEVDMPMAQPQPAIVLASGEKKLPALDLYHIAYLAGGSERVSLTVVTDLLRHGYLKHHATHNVLLPDQPLPDHATALEKATVQAFALSGATTLSTLESKLNADIARLRQALAQLQLLQAQGGHKAGRIILSLASFIGLMYWWPELICLTLPVALILIALLIKNDPLPYTAYGKEVLQALRHQQTREADLETRPGLDPLVLRTALNGAPALNNSELAYLPTLLQPPPSPSSDNFGCGC